MPNESDTKPIRYFSYGMIIGMVIGAFFAYTLRKPEVIYRGKCSGGEVIIDW